MKTPAEHDLAIVGAGLAGMAAAVFASNRGIATIQIGEGGGLPFASGLLDLMGVHPIRERKAWDDPWAAIRAVAKDLPGHPYARLEEATIRAAFDEFLSFLADAGLPYRGEDGRNVLVPTALGTAKPTFRVPESMWAGVVALRDRSPGLLVDFRGLKEYSARQVAGGLGERWPDLRAVTLPFPGAEEAPEVFSVHLARALEVPSNVEELARRIEPHVGGARVVGVPAILGIRRTREILARLEGRLGVAVFEIPTMPASVPGFRLQEAIESRLPRRGVERVVAGRVRTALWNERRFVLGIGDGEVEQTVRARSVILASGRFLGKGLRGDRDGIRETVFDLPVHAPASRADWHREDFLDPAGHPINSAGVEIDGRFRPLDREGRPAHARLFAAGTILAHQDWMRMKCGAGLAIASAYAAVTELVDGSAVGRSKE